MLAAKGDKTMEQYNVAQLPGTKLRVLKSKAIYGANASGKSNLVNAINAFVKITQLSVTNSGVLPRLIQPFLLAEGMEQMPTFMQMIFTLKDETNIERVYRYGFEVKDGVVVTEWLFGAPHGVEKPFFTREGMEVRVNANSFKEAKKFEDWARTNQGNIMRPDSLFLTAVAALGGQFAHQVMTCFDGISIYTGLVEFDFERVVAKHLENPELKTRILAFLKSADTDIEDILFQVTNKVEGNSEKNDLALKAEKAQTSKTILTARARYNADGHKVGQIAERMSLWESDGTKKMLALSPTLIKVLDQGLVLIMDEFDIHLHPNLVRAILNLFNSPVTNPKHAQLIFTVHDTSLQKPYLLRRDQICLIEKNKFGASLVKTLVEFKGVRNDAAYDKAYEQGEYGAVPFLNQLDSLFIQDA
ncbi:MAG: ATP-binding protein [Bernardetiaceae bacterium]|nr:ATP-binding protein [Bernardetiaceae bacterium]